LKGKNLSVRFLLQLRMTKGNFSVGGGIASHFSAFGTFAMEEWAWNHIGPFTITWFAH